MELTVRPAAVSDAAALAAIYAPYVRGTAVTMELEPPDASAFAARIAATLRRYPYLAARLDGRTVGYAYAGPFHARPAYDWSVETSIYVAQDCHGRGVGRALYEHAKAFAKDSGCYNLTLNVWAGNDSAHRFYEAMGMKPQKYGMETIL